MCAADTAVNCGLKARVSISITRAFAVQEDGRHKDAVPCVGRLAGKKLELQFGGGVDLSEQVNAFTTFLESSEPSQREQGLPVHRRLQF
jgi:hypothetical protein